MCLEGRGMNVVTWMKMGEFRIRVTFTAPFGDPLEVLRNLILDLGGGLASVPLTM